MWERLVMRLLDVTVAAVALVLLAPLTLVITYLIKRESPGPAIFQQVRVGYHGHPFVMYKFRTMSAPPDQAGPAPGQQITPLGRWLRTHSLDELPQLFNVLKGDMSLVGPRPELPSLVQRYTPWQRQRLLIQPGVTGLWQVLGPKHQPITDNLQYDFYYLRHRSLWLYIWILVSTIPLMVQGRR